MRHAVTPTGTRKRPEASVQPMLRITRNQSIRPAVTTPGNSQSRYPFVRTLHRAQSLHMKPAMLWLASSQRGPVGSSTHPFMITLRAIATPHPRQAWP